jgi:hypothetical protein
MSNTLERRHTQVVFQKLLQLVTVVNKAYVYASCSKSCELLSAELWYHRRLNAIRHDFGVLWVHSMLMLSSCQQAQVSNRFSSKSKHVDVVSVC